MAVFNSTLLGRFMDHFIEFIPFGANSRFGNDFVYAFHNTIFLNLILNLLYCPISSALIEKVNQSLSAWSTNTYIVSDPQSLFVMIDGNETLLE